MLHRGSKMVFIEWKDDFKTISKCQWMDLVIIGNIRPDWFMDARGDATDVQYIGDSHIFYQGKIRLVKQWRKKDFANQYFTMSVQRLPGGDGVHWPLVLNVPGEGFGDDFLQHYSDHELLNESVEAPFLLDESYEAAGGSCPQMADGVSGPPVLEKPVPSNLELEDASWRSIVWTGSPVWTPPAEPDISNPTITDGLTVDSCWDESTGSVRVTSNFKMETPVWAAIGFRTGDSCAMTPVGGDDGEVVFAHQDAKGKYSVMYGPLPASSKKISDKIKTSFYAGLLPVDKCDGFSSSSVEHIGGHLKVTFQREYPLKPRALPLTYAWGSSKEYGYHKSRGCFNLGKLPACSSICNACPTCR